MSSCCKIGVRRPQVSVSLDLRGQHVWRAKRKEKKEKKNKVKYTFSSLTNTFCQRFMQINLENFWTMTPLEYCPSIILIQWLLGTSLVKWWLATFFSGVFNFHLRCLFPLCLLSPPWPSHVFHWRSRAVQAESRVREGARASRCPQPFCYPSPGHVCKEKEVWGDMLVLLILLV